MAMGTREQDDQGNSWIPTSALPTSASHPFYEQVNRILDSRGFNRFVEDLCRKFYHERMGRPSLAPAVYFRLMLIGYFEGIDSERGMAWRAAWNYAWSSAAAHAGRDRSSELLDLSAWRAVWVPAEWRRQVVRREDPESLAELRASTHRGRPTIANTGDTVYPRNWIESLFWGGIHHKHTGSQVTKPPKKAQET